MPSNASSNFPLSPGQAHVGWLIDDKVGTGTDMHEASVEITGEPTQFISTVGVDFEVADVATSGTGTTEGLSSAPCACS